MTLPPSLDVVALFMAHGRRRYGDGVTDLPLEAYRTLLVRRLGPQSEGTAPAR